jgi:sphingomyelin phosphodiesterase acid-like 3
MRLARAGLSFLVFSALIFVSAAPAKAAPRQGDQIWLGVSDIHLDPFDRSARASGFGFDSNSALFRSALVQMKRTAPDPSVILLLGDFLEHNFAQHVRESGDAETPDQAGIRTMQQIVSAFSRAFPNSQFVIALGNNDAPCGDYQSAEGSAYLRSVARIWTPLVDRSNAAPDFVASFARNGYYTVQLPIHGLRLIVLDTLLLSQQYRGNCGTSEGGPSKELSWLRAILRDSPAGTRNVIAMHIPPGFDPFSTQYAHGFLAWPFLRSPYNRILVSALSANSARIAFVLAGHAHRFDFRLAGKVPIVVLGSISPIFDNNPGFYVLHVSRAGSMRDIDIYNFDESLLEWLPKRSFDATWGIAQVDDASLARLHARIEVDAAMREAWGAQADGWPPTDLTAAGPWGTRWWRAQWCAQTLLVSGYAECAHIERRITVLRWLAVVGALIGVIVALLATWAVKHRRPSRQE